MYQPMALFPYVYGELTKRVSSSENHVFDFLIVFDSPPNGHAAGQERQEAADEDPKRSSANLEVLPQKRCQRFHHDSGDGRAASCFRSPSNCRRGAGFGGRVTVLI